MSFCYGVPIRSSTSMLPARCSSGFRRQGGCCQVRWRCRHSPGYSSLHRFRHRAKKVPQSGPLGLRLGPVEQFQLARMSNPTVGIGMIESKEFLCNGVHVLGDVFLHRIHEQTRFLRHGQIEIFLILSWRVSVPLVDELNHDPNYSHAVRQFALKSVRISARQVRMALMSKLPICHDSRMILGRMQGARDIGS